MLKDAQDAKIYVVTRQGMTDEAPTVMFATKDKTFAHQMTSTNDGKDGESWTCSHVPLHIPSDPRLDTDWHRLRALAEPQSDAEALATDNFAAVRHLASVVARLYRPEGEE